MSILMASIPPRGTLRHRPSHILPNFQNAAPDMDNLHDLLRFKTLGFNYFDVNGTLYNFNFICRYIGHTSPECLENPDQDLSEPGPTPFPFQKHTEAEVISSILAQRTLEIDYKQFS